jgi:hypothetical protein
VFSGAFGAAINILGSRYLGESDAQRYLNLGFALIGMPPRPKTHIIQQFSEASVGALCTYPPNIPAEPVGVPIENRRS